ncbi:hypothetical protein DPX16_20557 [Anabarilius grahami]|uniref:Uncharacterized protein n=1 Tax=Anabarilius grahami TaxID=495550 RepID=A0A3N0YKX4_ANAGA|nr:hypothetical protein DPX16_20557 [Anabarilius grahami]
MDSFLAVQLLCLEQKDHSLEAHLEDFIRLVPSTTFPDSCLCSFLYAGLNTATKALLSGEGPQGSFMEYVEWVLVSCDSPLTVDIVDDDTSPTSYPVPSHQHLDYRDRQPEPTTGNERHSAAMYKPAHTRATELNIATEPERRVPEQVCEPAASTIAEGVLVEFDGMERSSAHPPATESEDTFELHAVQLELEALERQIRTLLEKQAELRERQTTLETSRADAHQSSFLPQSPTNPVVPSSMPPISPSAPPLSGESTPRVLRESSLHGCEKPLALPSASARSSPPRSVVGSTWVRYRYTYATDLQAGRYSPALHPFVLGQLLPPSGSASALGRSCSTSALRISTTISGGRHCGYVAAVLIFGVPLLHQLSGFAVGSIIGIAVASGCPHGGASEHISMAPPS